MEIGEGKGVEVKNIKHGIRWQKTFSEGRLRIT
jgi:hypothetical protein